MSTINWLIATGGPIALVMDIALSPLPSMPDGRLPRRAIRDRLREIAALRRSQQRAGPRQG